MATVYEYHPMIRLKSCRTRWNIVKLYCSHVKLHDTFMFGSQHSLPWSCGSTCTPDPMTSEANTLHSSDLLRQLVEGGEGRVCCGWLTLSPVVRVRRPLCSSGWRVVALCDVIRWVVVTASPVRRCIVRRVARWLIKSTLQEEFTMSQQLL